MSAGRVHWFDEIASTNNYIAQHADAHGRVCLAGLQTQGRGQRGKQWQAPFMSSVLMSLGWKLPVRNIGGLSLVCGLAVKSALESMHVAAVTLKWPNDVLLDGKKLGGILVEVTGQKVVIGVGMNVNLGDEIETEQFPVQTRLPWTDLHRSGYEPERSSLVAALIIQLSHTLENFAEHGFDSFRETWMQAHHFHQKPVAIKGAEDVEGIVTGVDTDGGLIVDLKGETRIFYAGEISMSPASGGV